MSAGEGGTTPNVSLVLVTYRSGRVVAEAVESFRREASGAGVTAEVVVVDHSGSPEEEAAVAVARPDRLLVRENRGFAAGINAGVAASSGRTVFAGNPDIVFQPGSVTALLAALEQGWHIVGPSFEHAGWQLPPADLQTPAEELRRALAGRSKAVWNAALRAELGRWLEVWRGAGPVARPTLSGAMIVALREVWERVGPWDESYFLYFEETDWLRRARRRGLTIAQVAGARVAHAWGESADPMATAAVQARSRARYFARHHRWFRPLLGRLPAARWPAAPRLEVAHELTGARLWLLSPSPVGMPAAGCLAAAGDALERASRFAAAHRSIGRYLLVAAAADGARILHRWIWEPARA